jgi:hypothetical protein
MAWKSTALSRIRPHLSSLWIGFALCALVGCLATPAGKASGGNPNCSAYCDARKARGCAGISNTCETSCIASYIVAESQGMCSKQYAAVQDCEYSQAAVDLGCVTNRVKLDSLCHTQSDAWDACVLERDGK